MSDKVITSFQVSRSTRDMFKVACIKNGFSMVDVLDAFMTDYYLVTEGSKLMPTFKEIYKIK